MSKKEITPQQKFLRAQARLTLEKYLNAETSVQFKSGIGFQLYNDTSGQRSNYILPCYRGYGIHIVYRYLEFINNGDEGKDGAVLGEIHLDEANVISIKENEIEFEFFSIRFFRSSRRMTFVEEFNQRLNDLRFDPLSIDSLLTKYDLVTANNKFKALSNISQSDERYPIKLKLDQLIKDYVESVKVEESDTTT